MRTIGFIGLGNMGLPMAGNLQQAGHVVQAFDSSDVAIGRAEEHSLMACASLAESLADADLIITMLPDGHAVLGALTDICDRAASDTIIVDCSTIDTDHARQAHEQAAAANLGFLDVPVSGGIAGAAAGTLTGMVGGDPALLDAVKPILDPMFSRLVHCGGAGAGQVAKLCNNLLLATTMVSASEAFSLGRKLGLDAEALFDVLSTSTGACWSVTDYCPLPGVGPESPADRDYAPGFPARLMIKDLNLAGTAAESVQQATPLATHTLSLYEQFVDAGGGLEDFSGIIRYIDALDR